MNKLSAIKSPRRAADDINISDVVVTTESTSAARRRRASSMRRGLVATVLTGALVAGGLFSWAATSRGGAEDFSSENVSLELAIPQAAVDAAELGFADRSVDASRSAVRSNLTAAVAGEAAKDRTAVLGASVEAASKSMTEGTASEREAQMVADMVLVDAQETKLKKEAEEAARRLEEARKAAEAAKAAAKADSTNASGGAGATGPNKRAATEISAEDVAVLSSTGGSMPLKSNFRVGARFGATGSWSRYHTGQDFPAPTGTPIYAVASGIVLSPTAGGWAGTNVVIQHAGGGSTLYAHMSRRVANTGQAVKAGQLIGYVGTSGRSFGAHLHMEYYRPGITPGKVYDASNPVAFMRSLGVNI